MRPNNVVFLIGAGASKHFGFPDTRDFLQQITTLAGSPPPQLLDFDHGGEPFKFYHRICDYFTVMRGKNGFDIEDIYTRILDFHDDMSHLKITDENTKFFAFLFLQDKFKVTRDGIKINPNVWQDFEQKSKADINRTIKIIQQSIEYLVIETYRKVSQEHRLNDYDRLFSFIQEMNISNQNVSIFTTNYDRVLEEYFRKCRIENRYGFDFEDGFEEDWRYKIFKQNRLENTHKIRLFKLHGSIDRYLLEGKDIIVKVEVPIGYFDDKCIDNNVKKKMLIYPKRKEIEYIKEGVGEFELTQFKEQLAIADLVISLGFSFRDVTIKNAVIENHQTSKQAIVLISPHSEEKAQELKDEFKKELNIHPLEREFPNGLQPDDLINHIKGIEELD